MSNEEKYLKVFTGNANPKLAHAVAQHLNIPLGRATVNRFSDGEVMVEINENVRGADVFVVQSTCAPTNDNLMELMIMTDALRRASAHRITAVMPYYGYARQDRRPRSARVAISAKVVANMLQSVGVDRVLTMDLHAAQIQGFFEKYKDLLFNNQAEWMYTKGDKLDELWVSYFKQASDEDGDVKKFQGDMKSDAVKKRLKFEQMLGKRVNLHGTPLFRINGEIVSPAELPAKIESYI